jgi:hypothetical protein
MTGFASQRPLGGTPALVTKRQPEECFGVANSLFVLGPEPAAYAETDRGTKIPLVRYEAVIMPDLEGSHRFDLQRDLAGFLVMLEELFLARVVAPGFEVTRLSELNPSYNCHGWIFAGGQCGVQDEHVATILNDHGYEMVSEPQKGDILVYRYLGRIVHSGVVRGTTDDAKPLVESKWGPFGLFLHLPPAHPGERTYYRTARPSHVLRIVGQ